MVRAKKIRRATGLTFRGYDFRYFLGKDPTAIIPRCLSAGLLFLNARATLAGVKNSDSFLSLAFSLTLSNPTSSRNAV